MPDLTNLFSLLEEDGASVGLSKATGISSGNICDWKSGRSKPNAETLVKVADYFECSVDYLLGRTNIKKVNSEPITIYRFPVYKQQAAAGIGVLNDSEDYDMEEYQINNVPNNAVFAMKIKGDSMYDENTDHIKEKAVILINPKDTDYEGKIVIANLDDECVCKRYTTVGNHVEFKSDNVLRQNENKDSRNYRKSKVIGVVLGVIENEKFISVK